LFARYWFVKFKGAHTVFTFVIYNHTFFVRKSIVLLQLVSLLLLSF